MTRDRYGFSTGALEKSNFRIALDWMRINHVRSVELSALRFQELLPLVDAIDSLPIDSFHYVSFHAPSFFEVDQEDSVVDLLKIVAKRGWNIIVHPDVIYSPCKWQEFGCQLLIENMDRRKAIGRTVDELSELFKLLPNARLCLDLAHARQLDTTLGLLYGIIKAFAGRIAEIHISELDSRCRHRPLSTASVSDYHQFARMLEGVPVIIESILDHKLQQLRNEEVSLARKALA